MVQGYLEKAQGRNRVARHLLEREEWDDAVSRAYYAAYHAGQAALVTEGQRAETPRGLITLFGLLLVRTGKFEKRWGKFLANLKDDRETSHYEALSWIDEVTARRAVKEAEAFVEAVCRYVAKLA